MAHGRILGIAVSDEVLARWSEWFAPDPQPFLLEGDERVPVSDELRDTFGLYGLAGRGVSVRWIGEAEYFAMTRMERSELVGDQVRLGRALVPTVASIGRLAGPWVREQADGRRFVWWPSLLTPRNRRGVLSRFVTGDRLPSRHSEVPASVWRSAEPVLQLRVGLRASFRSGVVRIASVRS
jgi:hypothetical protein